LSKPTDLRGNIYILLFILMCFEVKAQEIVIQPPVFGPFECTEFFQLYTGSVTNFSQESFQTQLLLEVDYTSPAGNRERLAEGVLKGNPSVDFPPGASLINNGNYQLIYPNRNIVFYNKEIEDLLRQTACLPPGQYDVCLTLYDVNADPSGADFLTQTCYVREKEMLSQLFLVSPFEGEEITLDLPLFTWTSVTPFHPNAVYRLQVVEILAGQTAFEAFRSNPLWLEQKGLNSNIMQYPLAARSFTDCAEYAWRVTYELKGGFGESSTLQQSEIWTFFSNCSEKKEVKLHNTNKGVNSCFIFSLNEDVELKYQFGEVLHFEIDNTYYNLEKLKFVLVDEKDNVQTVSCCIDSTQEDSDEQRNIVRESGEYHENTCPKLDLSPYQLINNTNYKLILKDSINDYFINFKYVEDEEDDIMPPQDSILFRLLTPLLYKSKHFLKDSSELLSYSIFPPEKRSLVLFKNEEKEIRIFTGPMPLEVDSIPKIKIFLSGKPIENLKKPGWDELNIFPKELYNPNVLDGFTLYKIEELPAHYFSKPVQKKTKDHPIQDPPDEDDLVIDVNEDGPQKDKKPGSDILDDPMDDTDLVINTIEDGSQLRKDPPPITEDMEDDMIRQENEGGESEEVIRVSNVQHHYKILFSIEKQKNKAYLNLSEIGPVTSEPANNGYYMYYVGHFSSKEEAEQALKQVMNSGYRMASVLEFEGGVMEERSQKANQEKKDKLKEGADADEFISKQETTAPPIQEVVKKDVVSYHILFRVLDNPDQDFEDLKKVGELFRETFDEMGSSRYLVGDTSDLEEARKLLKKVQKAGYNAAMIAEYRNGELMNIINE
jgi:hypothetical protein